MNPLALGTFVDMEASGLMILTILVSVLGKQEPMVNELFFYQVFHRITSPVVLQAIHTFDQEVKF